MAGAQEYELQGGYPTPKTVQDAFDAVDLDRAVAAYRFFYPTVSGAALFSGTATVGVQPNKVFGYMDTQPKPSGYTLNSDTPYGLALLDLHIGPLGIELPQGPLISAALAVHQRWIMDMGLPGPDAGKGGKHVILPPGYAGKVSSGSYVGRATSYRVIVAVHSLPVGGDVPGAIARIQTVKGHPLDPAEGWVEPKWIDMTPMPQDTTPYTFEDKLEYWPMRHDVVNSEPPRADSRAEYGDLAALGIEKGQPFTPDARMQRLLTQAAKLGAGQRRVESFADRRADRVVWQDRQWQWAARRGENGTCDTPSYRDPSALDKWFFQAGAASPAMFRRAAGAGALYWLGLRDSNGAYLDGGKSYKLHVPLPGPGKLFWSVTVYDAETRSQVQTDQGKAARRSLFELKGLSGTSPDLQCGPAPPKGNEDKGIETSPGKGWFVYFRLYGPDKPAFDGPWKPGEFEEVQ